MNTYVRDREIISYPYTNTDLVFILLCYLLLLLLRVRYYTRVLFVHSVVVFPSHPLTTSRIIITTEVLLLLEPPIIVQ